MWTKTMTTKKNTRNNRNPTNPKNSPEKQRRKMSYFVPLTHAWENPTPLGEGHHSTAFLSTLPSPSRPRVVVKKLLRTKEAQHDVENEVAILQHLWPVSDVY